MSHPRFPIPVPLALAVALCAAVGPRPSGAAAAPAAPPAGRVAKEKAMSFQITSTAFTPGGEIPPRHTSDGRDVSPPLAWSGTPPGTKSLALIVDDPDAPDPKAPRVDWVHWVVYDLPPDVHALPEGATAKALPRGAHEGLNDWKRPGWRGPSPPVGSHRYYFRLYALDSVLPDLGQANRSALEKAMEGHVLARAELMGRYRKH